MAGRSMRDEVLEQLRQVEQQGKAGGQGGYINRDGLTWVFTRLDKNTWTPEKINMLLDAVDRKRDGRIRYQEFVDWVYQSTDEELRKASKGSSSRSKSRPRGEGSGSKASAPAVDEALRADLHATLKAELEKSRQEESKGQERLAELEKVIDQHRKAEEEAQKALDDKEQQVANLGISSMKFWEEANEAKRNEEAANDKVLEAEKKIQALEDQQKELKEQLENAMAAPLDVFPPVPPPPPATDFPEVPPEMSPGMRSAAPLGAHAPEDTAPHKATMDLERSDAEFADLRSELHHAQLALDASKNAVEQAEVHCHSEEAAYKAQKDEIDRLLAVCDELEAMAGKAKQDAIDANDKVAGHEIDKIKKEEELLELQEKCNALKEESQKAYADVDFHLGRANELEEGHKRKDVDLQFHADEVERLKKELAEAISIAEQEREISKLSQEAAERTDMELENSMTEIAELTAICEKFHAEAMEAVKDLEAEREVSQERGSALKDHADSLERLEAACDSLLSEAKEAREHADLHVEKANRMERERNSLIERSTAAELERDSLLHQQRQKEAAEALDRESSAAASDFQIQEIARLEATAEALRSEMNQAIEDALDAERRAEDSRAAELASRLESHEHARMSKAQNKELGVLLDKTAQSKAEAAQVRAEVFEAVERVGNAETAAEAARRDAEEAKRHRDECLTRIGALEAQVESFKMAKPLSPDDFDEVRSLRSDLVVHKEQKKMAEERLGSLESRLADERGVSAETDQLRIQLLQAQEKLLDSQARAERAERQVILVNGELSEERRMLDDKTKQALELELKCDTMASNLKSYELSCESLRDNLRFEAAEVREAYALVDDKSARSEMEVADLRTAHTRAVTSAQANADRLSMAESSAERCREEANLARQELAQAAAKEEYANKQMQDARDNEDMHRGKLHAKAKEAESLATTCVHLRSEAATMWNEVNMATRRCNDAENQMAAMRYSEARAFADLRAKTDECANLNANLQALRAENYRIMHDGRVADDRVSSWKREVAESRQSELTMAQMLQMKTAESEHLKVAQVTLRAQIAKLQTDMSINDGMPMDMQSHRTRASSMPMLNTPQSYGKTVNGMHMIPDGGRTPVTSTPAVEQEAAMSHVLKALAGRGCASAAAAFQFFNPGKDKTISSRRMLDDLVQWRILPVEQCQRFVQSLDPDNTGKITYKAFRSAVAAFLASSSDFHATLPDDQYNAIMYRVGVEINRKQMTVSQVFNAWDYDRSNFLDCQEFVRGLRSLKIGLAEKEIVQIFNHLTGGSMAGESPAVSAASSARASQYNFGAAGGGRKLNISEFEKLLRVHADRHGKLKEWAERQFTELNPMVLEAAVKRYADQPSGRHLRFTGFKAMLNEVYPTFSSANITKLWCVLPKDDLGEDSAVEVGELVRNLRPSQMGGAQMGMSSMGVMGPEMHKGMGGTPTTMAGTTPSTMGMADTRRMHAGMPNNSARGPAGTTVR